MASHSTLPPDTLITAKITINNQTRRFKLALRDLGANVLPNKLRALLALPADQEVLFERYSDSAASYVTLDATNPAVYKQLYRAAKAKLKLRIKATPIYPVNDTVVPESDSITTERPFPPAYTSTTSLSTPEPIPTSPDVFPAQLDKAVADAVSTFLNGEEYLTKLRETVREEVQKQEKEAPVPAPFTAPQIMPAELPSPFTQTKPVCTASAFTYAIFCDACDGKIFDAHYHCGICDKGDYDLCQTCVNRGVHCKDSAHWLIKRSLQGGNIVSSITESIKAKTPDATKPYTHILTRTCNSCVAVLPEKEFVTCVTCDDYDVCIPCHTRLRHGHHPRHEFAPATKDTKLDSIATKLCAPGRNFRHYAICDGCENQIFGVRHKCMTCPDWDYCSDCITSAPLDHHGHRFVPIYDPLPVSGSALTYKATARHFGVYCDGPLCANKLRRSWISGDRYKCAVCPDTDFCAACESVPTNPHNQTHPLIKIKSPIRNVHITTIEPDATNPRVMGDAQIAPPATSNAATQVQTVADVKPTEEFEPVENVEDLAEDVEELAELATSKSVESVREPAKEPAKESVSESEPLLADFIREAIQDGTVQVAGASFTQTWFLVNSSKTSWPAGVQPQFTAGDYMFVDPEVINATTTGYEVLPGQIASFSVNLKAPLHTNRRHISYWRLTAPDGTKFGSKLWCDIQVVDPTPEEVKVEVKVEEVKVEEVKVEEESATENKSEFEEVSDNASDSSQTSSQMIFPRLPVESPVASVEDLSAGLSGVRIETESVPAVAVATPELRETIEEDSDEEIDVSSIGDDLDSFLTDDEYDVLDASDEEAFEECERVV